MSQSQKPIVLVSGATGNVGTCAVKALAEKYGEQVKILAGVRDESKAAKTFEGVKNIEFVKFDTDKPETVDKALQNIDAFFLIPPNPNNLGDGYNRQKTTFALIEAAKKNGVKFVLMIDLLVSGDHKFVFGPEFEEYFKALQATGIPHARLTAPNFCENLWGNVVTLKSDSAFYLPLPADAKWNYVAVQDLGAAAAAILADSTKHAGKIYTITGPTLTTNNEIATELSKLTGRTITAHQGSHQQYSDILINIVGFPKWEVDGILQLWDMYTAATGKARLITNDFYNLTGQQPTDMNEWVKRLVPAIQQ